MAYNRAHDQYKERAFNNAIPLECQKILCAEVAKKLGVDEEKPVRIRVQSLTKPGFLHS